MSDFEKEKQAFEYWDSNGFAIRNEFRFADMITDGNVNSTKGDVSFGFYGGYHSRDEEVAELKGELAKKNEAIRKIANMSFDEYHSKIGWMHHYKGSIYEAVGIARSVLGYSLQGIIPQEEHEQALQGEEE
jgi:hypothetical protein